MIFGRNKFKENLKQFTFPPVLNTKLQELADALDKPKPLGERERATLLSIIAALAEKAKIDLSQNSKAAAFIEAMTERIGLRVAVRTVENKLKDIKELRDRSGKTSD